MTKKAKAFIFTEGGSRVGFGHIVRCLALKDALNLQGISTKLIVNVDSLAKKQFAGQIDIALNWIERIGRVKKLLNRDCIAIIDSYQAHVHTYRIISRRSSITVYFDDFARLNYPPGIVINGAVNAEQLAYPASNGMTYLLGSRYVHLRRVFLNAPNRTTRQSIRDVLITFGGMDQSVFINKMLRRLTNRHPEWRFHVITSSEFCSRVDGRNNVSYYRALKASQIKNLMLQCDVAISGGGQTTNELAVCGLPMIGICFAENQKRTLQGWKKEGVLLFVGNHNNKTISGRVESALQRLSFFKRSNMALKGQRLVDGCGARNTAKFIQDACFKFENVRLGDRKQIFKWSNSRTVRSASFNSKPIKWNEHCEWFNRKLRDTSCSFYKIVWLNHPIGQVRFDCSGDGAIVSVALDKRFRGNGLGSPAIRLSAEQVFNEQPRIKNIDAFVKMGNTPSRKVFLKAGFYRAGFRVIRGHRAYRFRKGKNESIASR